MHNYHGKKKAQTSGIHRTGCETDEKLIVLNLNLDNLPENALPETDLKLN
jgi:hypothetical protein